MSHQNLDPNPHPQPVEDERAKKNTGCMHSVGKFFSCINPWYKPEIYVPPGHWDLSMILENRKFGDIFLIRTDSKLDNSIAVDVS